MGAGYNLQVGRKSMTLPSVNAGKRSANKSQPKPKLRLLNDGGIMNMQGIQVGFIWDANEVDIGFTYRGRALQKWLYDKLANGHATKAI